MNTAFLLRFIYRNLRRHPLRSGLTALAVTIAILAFVVLRTMVDSWYVRAEAASATRLVTRNAISITSRLPLAYKDKIRRVKGVVGVTYGNWFSGIYINEKNVFPQLAVDPESYLTLHPEFVLSPAERSAFVRDRNSAVAGRALASRYGWRIGDVIPLTGINYPGNWNFVLRGIYEGAEENTDEGVFFFHWDALNEQLRQTAPNRTNQVGVYFVGIQNANQAAEVARDIDRLFKNSLAETLTETQRAFRLGFIAMGQTVLTAIEWIGFVVIAIIMVVVANAMAMSARERLREYATLKALGFGPRHLIAFIVGESLMVSIGAGMMGALLSYPAIYYLRVLLYGTFPLSGISEQAIGMGIAMALLIGIVGAAIPVYRTVSTPVTQGLRSIG